MKNFVIWNAQCVSNRRNLLKAAVVLILVVCTALAVFGSAKAQAQTLKLTERSALLATTNSEVYRFQVGALDALVVSDGTLTTAPLPNYAPTAKPVKVEQALRDRFLPPNELTLYFNALYLDTGDNKILVDTGAGRELGATLGRLASNLQAAGIQPENIDTVILTHAHPDHIGGILKADGTLAYPNAQYYICEAEWKFWTAPTIDLTSLKLNENFKQAIAAAARRHLGAIRDRVTLFQPGQEIISGIQAIGVPGHTPGHTALLIASGDSQLIHAADVFFNEAFDLEHPDWQTGFDLDPYFAAVTRRQLLDKVTASRTLLIAYHMPFPALGHVRVRSDRHEWEPTLWQFDP